MKELSLNILDITQNSIRAEAKKVRIELSESGARLSLQISDDGFGMDSAMLERVVDPFVTTRDTRSIGLGIPLLKLAAEMAGGGLEIESAKGEGTTVRAWYDTSHIDAQPIGDMAMTIFSLIQGNPEIDFLYRRQKDGELFELDSSLLREELGEDVSLSEPEVLRWIYEYIEENSPK